MLAWGLFPWIGIQEGIALTWSGVALVVAAAAQRRMGQAVARPDGAAVAPLRAFGHTIEVHAPAQQPGADRDQGQCAVDGGDGQAAGEPGGQLHRPVRPLLTDGERGKGLQPADHADAAVTQREHEAGTDHAERHAGTHERRDRISTT